MNGKNSIAEKIHQIEKNLIQSGYFRSDFFGRPPRQESLEQSKVEFALRTAREASNELKQVAEFLHTSVVMEILNLDHRTQSPEDFDAIRGLLEKLLAAAKGFKTEHELVPVYGELLSIYLLALYRCGSPDRESPIIRAILTNISRRKAIELDHSRLAQAFSRLEDKITIAILAKRYATYVLATRGLKVLFRSEIEFRTFGTSPEALALQITNILLRNGIRLSDVTDVVCGGGDLGTIPDGIYVLTEKVRDESWKRLHNSSLNRGALIAWELRNLLKPQGHKLRIHASLCSPLSFSTLDSHKLVSLFREESRELKQSLKGFVKVTPLKSIAALLSEIEGINPETLNLLVMTLDELFASAAKKIGPRIVRELAAQDANSMLINFDFGKIVDHLKQEKFLIPQHFRLASKEIGTGVKEVCELLMIVNSGKISPALSNSLMHVVDCYARQVAQVLETASAGEPSERPHYVVITSMMALDPIFQELFDKIRNRIDNPFTPMMCLDSLEHEYLIASQLFEMYMNPAPGDKRLHYTVEATSMKQALQVLGAAGLGDGAFSFSSLLDEVTGSIAGGRLSPANLVLVGADNEDALVAVSNAKDYGLVDRLALIGNPEDIMAAVDHAKVPLSPGTDPKVEIVPINPLATDYDSKKTSMAETFRSFLKENSQYIVMKGSVDTATLLKEALSIYKTDEEPEAKRTRKLASHTALFVLPDGRFFALSDAAVNPGFRTSDALLRVTENQIDVVRTVIHSNHPLKVAIITAVEKETSAIPSTLLAAETEQRAKSLESLYGPLIVEGPLSFDIATVPDVAEEKHYEGGIKGDANCFVATDINTANVLYKMLSKTMGSLGLMVDNGGIITAGPGTVPIVLTSRGDTAQTKFNSILLALAYSSSPQRDRMSD
ncbi:MAG TPA: phosphate acyltransferase [Desulfomonilaceae bacterium]|nr:phosphate acyltransferase [Desulfomonilaceae bacterium]